MQDKAIDLLGLQEWWRRNVDGELDDSFTSLRSTQMDIISWAQERHEPYLIVNAPTGVGKTLSGGLYAAQRDGDFSYIVSTRQLQRQVSEDLGIPTLMGRNNFTCLIGQQTHGVTVDASKGKCNFNEWCQHSGIESKTGLLPLHRCDYYEQKYIALQRRGRVSNYPMILKMPELRVKTKTLICDEAHRIEGAVINAERIVLPRFLTQLYGLRIPLLGNDVSVWRQWASRYGHVKSKKKYDTTAKSINDNFRRITNMGSEWLVDDKIGEVSFTPVFGGPFVLPSLFGHDRVDARALLEGDTGRHGIEKVMLMSATMLAPDITETTLGLPAGTWAYLDLPSPFPVGNRPINFAPVAQMNMATMKTREGREPVATAMDKLIDHYLLTGRKSGIIHAVSKVYQTCIIADSRWRSIMVTDVDEHAKRVSEGKPSVLVSYNIIDGWDGADNLCRFVLIPKVPFPNLGDRHVKERMRRDQRSYDYQAIVSVVQGVGRGVRHKEDVAESWILDSNWEGLYKRRGAWLPESFLSAYHHGVSIV